MLSSAALPRRRFLSWDRPWLPQVVEWLARDWSGRGPLDLSNVLALVPTRQSGRRLREALAGFAQERQSAVFPPRVLTPETLIALECGEDVASPLESWLAWTEVFRDIDLDTFRAVFPVDPPVRNFPWTLRLAQQFARVQTTLAEAGLQMADVPTRAGREFAEAERWRQIADLDRLHAARLRERGRREPQAARIAAARRPLAGESWSRFVMLGVPDPQPLALERLAAIAGSRPIDVVVLAPEAESDGFDAWGRPVAAYWDTRVIPVEDFERHVHLCPDPAAQAGRLAALARRYSPPTGILALASGDPEITPLLENALARVDQPSFNPEGHVRRRGGFYELLACLAALSRDPAFEAVEALARCPDFLEYLRSHSPPEFSPVRWLGGLDDLRASHLPADLYSALEFVRADTRSNVARGLDAMLRLRNKLNEGGFSAGTAAALAEIFTHRQLDLAASVDAHLQESAVAWTALLRECTQAEARFPGVATADWWDLALKLFGDQPVPEDKPAGAVDLLGWLELLWEDAPHLAIAGMNDGRVPEALDEDAFLPPSLRRLLGLRTNEARFARDAYLLQAVIALRRRTGRVDFLVGRTTAAGDPLRPSRLLLRCPDADLPARVALLFRSPEVEQANSPWTRAWKLQPRKAPPPERVAVTALRRYLECPFRFYLRSVLRMQSVDPLKSELDAFDFGILCHSALENLGTDPALRDCTEPDVLRAELLERLDRAVRKRYGSTLALPLLVQVESARQRVGRLAELQAAERAAGWQIIEVERPFEVEVAGLLVRGKIDRIDRHEESGAIRVLDYKTSDKAVTPPRAHLHQSGGGPAVTPTVTLDGDVFEWTDLQLPMYLRAIAPIYGGRPSCGYMNLPKAAGETMLALWDDYSPEIHESAMQCAERVCAAIRRGEFWPPNLRIDAERDDYATLFQQGVEASVEWVPE